MSDHTYVTDFSREYECRETGTAVLVEGRVSVEYQYHEGQRAILSGPCMQPETPAYVVPWRVMMAVERVDLDGEQVVSAPGAAFRTLNNPARVIDDLDELSDAVLIAHAREQGRDWRDADAGEEPYAHDPLAGEWPDEAALDTRDRNREAGGR